MTPKLWFIYLGLFALATFIDSIGGGTYQTVDSADSQSIVSYQLDEEQSGSGFLGLPRPGLTFGLQMVPKFVTWNFGFLSGGLDIIQYTMIFMFGGLLMLTWGGSLLGLVRRNF